MKKILIISLVLLLSFCFTASAEDKKLELSEKNKQSEIIDYEILIPYLEKRLHILQDLYMNIHTTRRIVNENINSNTKDFVPMLFAESRLTNTCTMIFSVMAELIHVMEYQSISPITLELLDGYIDFLKYDLIKSKLFEGMIQKDEVTKELIIMKTTTIHLKVTYDLFKAIKKRLENF